MINYNKLGNDYFVVSTDRQTFLGSEMTANLSDTSPFSECNLKGRSHGDFDRFGSHSPSCKLVLYLVHRDKEIN